MLDWCSVASCWNRSRLGHSIQVETAGEFRCRLGAVIRMSFYILTGDAELDQGRRPDPLPKKEMRRSDCLRPQHLADWCSCRSLASSWRGNFAACREIRIRFAHIGRNRKFARVHGAMNRPNRHSESLFRRSGKLADSYRGHGGGKVRTCPSEPGGCGGGISVSAPGPRQATGRPKRLRALTR